MKRFFVALFVACIILCAFCLCVNATDGEMRVLADVSPFVLENNLETFLNTFEETNEGWDVEDKNDGGNVTLAEKIDTFPYEVLSGDGCLIYRTKTAESGKGYTISKKYTTPCNLENYNHIFIAINCSDIGHGDYKLKIQLSSGGEKFSASGSINAGGWNGVFVDISSFEKRSSIDSFKITVSFEGELSLENGFEYYIDSIMLSQNSNVVNRFLYSADGYVRTDGQSVMDGDGMSIPSSSDNGAYVSSSGFAYSSLGNANCLKVEFSTAGKCWGVELKVFGNDGTLLEQSNASAEGSDGVYTAYLPVASQNISEISLRFDTLDTEKTDVLCIEPYSVYIANETTVGTVDTCALNSNTGDLIIKGNVKYEYINSEIYLFENDMTDVVDANTLGKQQALAKAVISSGDFIFRVNYSKALDVRRCLFKKYTVAIKNDSEYAIVGSRCVSNPEEIGGMTSIDKKQTNGKGVYGQSTAFMQEIGVSDTAIWVDIGKFFVRETDSEYKFECGSDVFFYNPDYVRTLTKQIQGYNEKQIATTLIVVVSDTGDEVLNRILIHPDANLNAKYCAYNTVDKTGLNYLRAFSEYIAREFCQNGSVSRVVFGDGVGFCSQNYNMGSKTLNSFTSEYAKALRVVYNAVKSYAASTDIYIYIDDNWDRDLPFDLHVRYDNRTLLDSLTRRMKDYGDIEWGIAQNLYPTEKTNYYSYSDNSITNSVNSNRLSFKNIGVIDSYLESESVTYHDSRRDYIIIEKTIFFNVSEEIKTADYIYNCYKALNSGASAYITDRSCNYNNAMKYVDTTLSLTASSFVPEVLGVSAWSSVIEGFLEENIVKTHIKQTKFSIGNPKYQGSAVICDFSSKDHGWQRYGNDEKITSDMTLLDKSNLLSLSLGQIQSGEKKGIVKRFDEPLDLSLTPMLSFDINIASLPTGVNSAELFVIFVSENRVFELSGNVKGAEWSKIYCDLSTFDGINEIEEIRILFSSKDAYFEGPQALLTSVVGHSSEYDDVTLEQMLNPVDQGVQRVESIRKYAIPLLVSLVVLASAALVVRRMKNKSR